MNIMKKLAAFIVMAALLCPLAYVQALPEAELSEVSGRTAKLLRFYLQRELYPT